MLQFEGVNMDIDLPAVTPNKHENKYRQRKEINGDGSGWEEQRGERIEKGRYNRAEGNRGEARRTENTTNTTIYLENLRQQEFRIHQQQKRSQEEFANKKQESANKENAPTGIRQQEK